MANKSFFEKMINTVSNLPWLKGSHSSSAKKKKQDKRFEQTDLSDVSRSLSEMNEHEFVQIVHAIFKQRGYTISEKHDGAYDGVDLVLKMYNETTYVQYQHWKEEVTDITAVGELYVAMEVEGAEHGIVITSGVFTSDALDFSLGKSLVLINGVDLSQMITALPATSDTDTEEKSEDVKTEPKKQEMPELDPLCPICSSKMVKRTAKKGKNAGNTFWGCSQFPNCRGVVSG